MAYAMEGGTPIVSSGDMGSGGLEGFLIGALLAGGGLFGNRGYGAAGGELAGFSALQNQLNGIQSNMGTGLLNSEISQLETALNAANIANLQGISNNALTYQSGNAAVQTALAAGNFTTLSSINGLGRDVVASANQNALQQLNSFNQLSTTVLQGFNEVGRDNATAFGQVQMSLNALSAQNAACCCELKSAIHADGEATRALINATNMAYLQAQLSDAKSVINSQNIINALKPVVVA